MKIIKCLILVGIFTISILSQTMAQELKLGSVQPLTGGGSLFGLTAKQGFTMAMEDLNQKGGVDGKKLEIILYDSTTKPPVAATLAQRLLFEDKVPLIFGSASSVDTLAMMEVTERAQFPLFTPSASAPLITEKGYKWIWRVGQTDKICATLLGKAISRKSDWNKVAFLYENTDYGRTPCEVLAGILKGMKGKQVVGMEIYNKGDTDMTGQLMKLKNSNPDLLVTWGYYTEAALIARQAQQIGLRAKTQLFGNQSLSFPEYIKLAGPAAEGVMFIESTSSSINPNSKIQAFVKRYEEKFKRACYNTSVDCYDGVMIIAEVLKKVGTDPKRIQNALNTTTFEGTAESIKFDSRGQNLKGALMAKVEGGNFKFLEYLQY